MSYTLIEHTRPVAKKEHRCTWCGQQILAGDRYERQRGVFEGMPQTDKLHPECAKAADDWCWNASDEGYVPFENERPTPSPKTVSDGNR